ncbi:hypothetical protein [Streptomyces sp. NPDC047315]|uniref:hypothetical protein n=1 Tax=Streptomyces sp. NPDC047315 TaxID=3155142 RepID=UPI0033D70A8E
MPVARRPLLTAAAAGALLCALWFVPSTNAADGRPSAEPGTTGVGTVGREELRLTDPSSVDLTPPVLGGTAFLAVGVASVTIALRRGRTSSGSASPAPRDPCGGPPGAA